ncbi:hypothetical protein L1887_40494 [Cichorium endivia]|nr:hypothetical protein L1887_40494 [Cichorium endivia]
MVTGRVPEGELARLMEALDGAGGERKEPNSVITAIRFAKCEGEVKRRGKKMVAASTCQRTAKWAPRGKECICTTCETGAKVSHQAGGLAAKLGRSSYRKRSGRWVDDRIACRSSIKRQGRRGRASKLCEATAAWQKGKDP